MRIDRYLANAGVGTRREVHRYIMDKRVMVNGNTIKSISLNINPIIDRVSFDEEPVIYKEFRYFLINKPVGYMSSTIEERYPPVTGLIPQADVFRLFPVGRLDVDTTGTLLLTNNGKLAHSLLNPRFHVEKVYDAVVDRPLSTKLIDDFQNGLNINDEYVTSPAGLEIIDDYHARVSIHEGKYHQIKRMFIACGYNVISLNRSQFAFLDCTGLKEGEYRELNPEEVNKLLLFLR